MLALEAIEEAFLTGDWPLALQESKAQLVQYASEGIDGAFGMPLSAEHEQLLSLYLQSVFELGKQDELETAALIVQSLSPLPFHISIQWIKFLIAMEQQPIALELVNDLLEACSNDLGGMSSRDCYDRYQQTMEVLVFHLLLPTQNVDVVRAMVSDDTHLDEACKSEMLEMVQAWQANHTPEQMNNTAPSNHSGGAPARSTHGERATRHGNQSQHPASASSHRADATGSTSDDEDAGLAIVGGTALALAVVAFSVYRYRGRLGEAVSSIGPTISRGFADAKFALFES